MKVKSITYGVTATLVLLLVYFLLMRVLTGSFEAGFCQFKKLWFLMLPLSIGFGTQVGLYHYLKTSSSKTLMAANTATSTIGMIACCAHHLTDVLPILGLSALTLLLVEFQIPILILGILSNFFGIFYLSQRIRRNRK